MPPPPLQPPQLLPASIPPTETPASSLSPLPWPGETSSLTPTSGSAAPQEQRRTPSLRFEAWADRPHCATPAAASPFSNMHAGGWSRHCSVHCPETALVSSRLCPLSPKLPASHPSRPLTSSALPRFRAITLAHAGASAIKHAGEGATHSHLGSPAGPAGLGPHPNLNLASGAVPAGSPGLPPAGGRMRQVLKLEEVRSRGPSAGTFACHNVILLSRLCLLRSCIHTTL